MRERFTSPWSSTSKMEGVEVKRLDLVLNRVFARYRIPFEIRSVIWSLVVVDLEVCRLSDSL